MLIEPCLVEHQHVVKIVMTSHDRETLYYQYFIFLVFLTCNFSLSYNNVSNKRPYQNSSYNNLMHDEAKKAQYVNSWIANVFTFKYFGFYNLLWLMLENILSREREYRSSKKIEAVVSLFLDFSLSMTKKISLDLYLTRVAHNNQS